MCMPSPHYIIPTSADSMCSVLSFLSAPPDPSSPWMHTWKGNGCPCPSGLSVSTGKDWNWKLKLLPSPPQSNIESGQIKALCLANSQFTFPSGCCCETPCPAEKSPSLAPTPPVPISKTPWKSLSSTPPVLPRSWDLGLRQQRQFIAPDVWVWSPIDLHNQMSHWTINLANNITWWGAASASSKALESIAEDDEFLS